MLIIKNLNLISVQSWTYLTLEYFHFMEFILNLVETRFQNVMNMYPNIVKKEVFLFTSIERSKLGTSVYSILVK